MKPILSHRWPFVAVLAGLFFLATAPPAEAVNRRVRKHFKPYTEDIDVDCPNCGWNTVELRSNSIPSSKPIVPFKHGTTCPVCNGRGRLMARVDWQHGYYLVEGFGVPPKDMMREYLETRSARLLRKMRLSAMRAAQVDCYRNVVALAARVRLDGDRLLGADMAQELRGRVRAFEEVGDGEWVEKNVSYPFFKMIMKVPLWGAEGMVAVFYKSEKTRIRKEKNRRPFNWRKALEDYKKNPEKWKPPGQPADPPDRETPPTPKDPEPGETPPGESPGATPEPGEVEPEPAEPSEEEPSEYDEIIIDARAPTEGGSRPNPALFPQVQFTDPKGNTHAVYDLAEVDDESVSGNGMVQYVNSNTPFEKISSLAGPRTLVLRASALRGEAMRVAGLNLSIFFQEGVDLKGPMGKQKKKFTFKFKASHAAGLQKANIMISAKDALELKKTDEAAKILSKCKVIIINGGDIMGKKGELHSR